MPAIHLTARVCATLGFTCAFITASIFPSIAEAVQTDNCNDDGPGSLRVSIAEATSGEQIHLSTSCSLITLTSGAVNVTVDSLILVGSATIDGGGIDRVFNHTGNGIFRLAGLLLRNGSVNGNGGCIQSTGKIALSFVSMTDCHAHGTGSQVALGGAIFGQGPLTIDYSALFGNSADGASPQGGAVFAGGGVDVSYSSIVNNSAIAGSDAGGFGGGVVALGESSILASVLSGNMSDVGGGIFTGGSGNTELSISNSTLSDNRAATGGALYASRVAISLSNATVAFNTASTAGGIGGMALSESSIAISSIVANNRSAVEASDIGLASSSPPNLVLVGLHNLIMTSSMPVPADTVRADPLLNPLADNGGRTLTLALRIGSPAIDAGSNGANFDFDQRGPGYARVVGSNSDIGAFEFGAMPDHIFEDNFDGTVARVNAAVQTR